VTNQISADPFAGLAGGYLEHCASSRGILRHELVTRQLREHMPRPPATVVDVGGGGGEQALRLAQVGYSVVVVDPSAAMLEEGRRRLLSQRAEIARRVSFVEASAASANDALSGARFDVVLCHGVLMYLEDWATAVGDVVRLTKPGGIISILNKNGDAVAMRAGLEGRYAEAVRAIMRQEDLGRLGVVTRAEPLQALADELWGCDGQIVAWYGVRVFSDHLADAPPAADFNELLEAEWLAGQTDPYRQVGRLLHVIARYQPT
jgi:S-adenosylmethionine-dependent methyltransferase